MGIYDFANPCLFFFFCLGMQIAGCRKKRLLLDDGPSANAKMRNVFSCPGAAVF